ncbi:MAG: glycosyltransferase family 4 protein [Gammaproteobacteria bacterium]
MAKCLFGLLVSNMTIRVLAITEHSDLPETWQFIGLHNAGVELRVICPDTAPHKQLLLNAGIKVTWLKLNSRFDSGGRVAIQSVLDEGEFDIVHVFNNKALQNTLPLVKNTSIKLIAYRGIVGNVSVFDPISWATYLNPRVDKIICVANAIRDFFKKLKFLWWHFPQDKAVTIYKGHDLSWYRKPAIPRSTWGVPDDAFLLGCIANERPRKGLSYLVGALPGIARLGLNIHLLLIGSVNAKKTLAKIQQSPLKKNIHLTGYRSDAAQVLAACDACILPAIKREGLPKAIIEGMVHRVTPIVTNTGGSPELIEPGVSGLVIEPASTGAISEAIGYLARNPVQNHEMGIAAQARIERDFNTVATVEQTLALYRELLQSGQRRSEEKA